MTSALRISAASRLHFGLLRFDSPTGSSYGGLGMMINAPRTIIEMQLSSEWHAEGPLAERAIAIAKLAMHSHCPDQDDAISIRVCEAPASHSGLGSGTQLAMSIAQGVRKLYQLPPIKASAIAASVDRGKRSAVGSHGFMYGGLIWEIGSRPEASLGALACRLSMPKQWRVLLITLPQEQGLSGSREQSAFDSLPPISDEITAKLQNLAEDSILPAVDTTDFETFSAAIHDYGCLAGSCFKSVQGGTYASPEIEQLVQQLRKLGIQGVGQSSWGPTVFAFAEDEDQAETLKKRIKNLASTADIQVAAPENRGAVVENIHVTT